VHVRVTLLLSLAAFGFVSGSAHAGSRLVADVPPDGIYGGNPTSVCEWPSTVFLGGCTGTLVHPEVVIYAAHCGTDVAWAWFGEDSNQDAGRYVSTEQCMIYPGGSPGSGNDFAFCTLAEPVDDVPIVPPLMGCEAEILAPGLETWLVGFGNTDTGGFGAKYEVAVELQYIENDEAFLGGGGLAPCYGDSGGPAFVRLPADIDPEQSWRVFGITSWGGECGGGGFYSMMHNGMTWFEDETGRDLTPCHDADGTWNPGAECSAFPLDPGVGVGSWPSCGAGPLSGVGVSCGPGGPDPGGESDGGTSSDDDGGDADGGDAEGGDASDAGDDLPGHDDPAADDDTGTPSEDDGPAGSAGDSGDADDDGDDDDASPDPQALPPGFGLGAADLGGCGCSARGLRSLPEAGILLVIAVLGRRRHPRTPAAPATVGPGGSIGPWPPKTPSGRVFGP